VAELAADGLILIDKPQGLTSQQAVSRIKHALHVKKVGHGGTLDPMATGLLVVGLGRATRLLGFVSGDRKRYSATIRLGQATTTDDAEGEPVGSPATAVGLSDEQIAEAMSGFTGDIEQVPSSVSAIKVDGKRAYALVRAGQDVQLKPRAVTVYSYELKARRNADPFVDLDVEVECSSGTYIRALARDLGQKLGVGGHLSALRRLSVGEFSVEDAQALPERGDPDPKLSVMPIASAAGLLFPSVLLTESEARDVHHGKKLDRSVPGDPTALFSPEGEFLALYQPSSAGSKPLAVFV
jgi:tRNA pseudouridine55 synthase